MTVNVTYREAGAVVPASTTIKNSPLSNGEIDGNFKSVKDAVEVLSTTSGAGLIGVTPVGGVTATTVQSAISELDTEKASFATLAASSGASLVGYDGGTVKDVLDNAKPMASYAALRAYSGTATQIRITNNGISGFFYRDDADTTAIDNGGTVIVAANGKRWKRDYDGVVNVKWFGAKGDGVTDDTLAITQAANNLKDYQTLDFGTGTYLISYKGTPYSSVYGNSVLDFLNKRGISIVGANATIKVVNHNIATYGGLRFANFKGCKYVKISGFIFDMTFTGVNTSALYYPFCGAITALDDDAPAPDFETLNSDFLIKDCTFKLFHPYGNWATTNAGYGGDINNGYKLFSIFTSGPYSPTQYVNQCRNIEVSSCTWKKGHNGYGIWYWSWNNCKVNNCIVEDWVTKHSDSLGALAGGGVAFIRHIPFRTQGMIVENNHFRAKPTAERTPGTGFEGTSQFFVLANNMGDIDWAKGNTVISNNTVVMGLGSQSGGENNYDTAVFFNGFGSLIVEGNTFDGHNGQDVNAGYPGCSAMDLCPGGFVGSGNGFAAITVNGNTFGPWLFGGIYFTNGASTEYRRRCKSLVVTNNQQHSGNFFLRTTAYAYQAFEGCKEMLIAGNLIQSINPSNLPPPNTSNYGIAISTTVASDVVICTNNIIKDRTYDILTLSAFCSSASKVKRFNNKIDNISIPYYASNVFPTDIVDGSQEVIARSSSGSFEPRIRCINESSTPAEISLYQQAGSSYIMSTNGTVFYTGGGGRVTVQNTFFGPAADNTIALGGSALRWSVVYAGTGTINTSDERSKIEIQSIEDAVLRAWSRVNYTQFKFIDSVEAKGQGARWHFGLIAQRVKEAFEAEGLDAFKYGLLCYDEWEDQYTDELVEVEEVTDSGSIIKVMKGTGNEVLSQAAGNRYGIRYEEALALECAYLRSKLAAL